MCWGRIPRIAQLSWRRSWPLRRQAEPPRRLGCRDQTARSPPSERRSLEPRTHVAVVRVAPTVGAIEEAATSQLLPDLVIDILRGGWCAPRARTPLVVLLGGS